MKTRPQETELMFEGALTPVPDQKPLIEEGIAAMDTVYLASLMKIKMTAETEPL